MKNVLSVLKLLCYKRINNNHANGKDDRGRQVNKAKSGSVPGFAVSLEGRHFNCY